MTPRGAVGSRDYVLRVEQDAAEELHGTVREAQVVVRHDLLRHSGCVHHNAGDRTHAQKHERRIK